MRVADGCIVELNTIIARNLAACRARKGMTKLCLAESAGISLRMYSYLESAQCTPNVDTLCRIYRALGVHPRVILPVNKELDDIY